MIKKFDSDNLKQLRIDIDAAFAAIRQKHGVALSIGTIGYDPDGSKATTKLTMVAVGDPNVASDPRAAMLANAKADFKRYAARFGLRPEQYGATFKHGRDTYKLVGFKPRATSFPILATRLSNGTTYTLPESAIASLQSDEHKEMFGNGIVAGESGTCSNDNAFDANWKHIGKCNRPATTSRKEGFGNTARMQPFCAECANLIDESRREMEAEGRVS